MFPSFLSFSSRRFFPFVFLPDLISFLVSFFHFPFPRSFSLSFSPSVILFLLFNPFQLLSVHLFFLSVPIVLSLFLWVFFSFYFRHSTLSLRLTHTFYISLLLLSSSHFYFSHFLSVFIQFLTVSLIVYLFYFSPALICFRSSLFRFDFFLYLSLPLYVFRGSFPYFSPLCFCL